jgi:uridine phosphorylase
VDLEAMHKELSKKDWLRWMGVSAKEAPQAVIIMGVLDYRQALDQWQRAFGNAQPTPLANAILASYQGLQLAVAAAYGAGLVADTSHAFCALGARVVILTGSFGALQPGMKVGDLLVPTWAQATGPVSALYIGDEDKPDASQELVAWLRGRCGDQRLPHHVGPMISAPSVLSETAEQIQGWQRQGFLGVDMEAAPIFAVAKSFGAKRAALLVRVDSPIEGQHLLRRQSKEDQQVLSKRLFQVGGLAVEVARAFS